ncbi:hypothetical protein AYL99_02166 [Fonsecaea erecta]|uniref:Uncharacterized protein n=1 Tax=Fonsecaea erecta TaxID=1367422 RepID=A0A178ZSZ5_9EURO|nr:hypothetical protein AYL99_02166 [Fonsecaea erecta]OAP62939.1 hypothetical protein AYL99_02166 [Fonsecaea erecta]
MGVLVLLSLLFFVPFLFFLGHVQTAFLALSSCLGERFRARVSGFTVNPRHGSYDRTYFRTMTNPGPSSSEHIELETMLNAQGLYPDNHDDDDDDDDV